MNINWMLAGKIVLAAVIASGLFGTGYVTAPKETAVVKSCDDQPIIIRPKIIIEGREVKPK